MNLGMDASAGNPVFLAQNRKLVEYALYENV